MTNYSIIQSRKGGRATAAASKRHDDAIIHRLLTDGYATQETSKLVARKVAEVKRELLDWNNSPSIIGRLEELSAEEAIEMSESADWLLDTARIDRMSDWYDEAKTAAMLSAARWVRVTHSVVSVVQLIEALRKSNYQHVEA